MAECLPALPAPARRDVLHKCLEHSSVNVQEALLNNPDAYQDESELACTALYCRVLLCSAGCAVPRGAGWLRRWWQASTYNPSPLLLLL